MDSGTCGAWVHDQAQSANELCRSALKSRQGATLIARGAISATRVDAGASKARAIGRMGHIGPIKPLLYGRGRD